MKRFGIGAAWTDVMEQMPEGWYLRVLMFIPEGSIRARKRGAHWRAQAVRRSDLGLGGTAMVGIGESATDALFRLADLLSGVGRRIEQPNGHLATPEFVR